VKGAEKNWKRKKEKDSNPRVIPLDRELGKKIAGHLTKRVRFEKQKTDRQKWGSVRGDE